MTISEGIETGSADSFDMLYSIDRCYNGNVTARMRFYTPIVADLFGCRRLRPADLMLAPSLARVGADDPYAKSAIRAASAQIAKNRFGKEYLIIPSSERSYAQSNVRFI
jgi:hypothetical protein